LPAIRRAGLRVGQCAIPIRPTGYVNAKKDARTKLALYRSLGEKKIADFADYYLGYVELGKVYLDEQALGEAARLFAHAIRLAPRCVEAHYFLALTLIRQQRYGDCHQLLKAASRRFRGNSDIRNAVDRLRLTQAAGVEAAISC
jgi:tetratricopeptide (TPR) repeat protein